MLFQYIEKWTKQENFAWRCVGFSTGGDYIAFGGANCLIIARADLGKYLAAVKHQASNVASLQWSASNVVLDEMRTIPLDQDD
jgi:hypothetical protein